MTERSSGGLDERRRKLLFRAWRRGVREMDLIVGRFADAHIDTFDAARPRRFRAADRGAQQRPLRLGHRQRTRTGAIRYRRAGIADCLSQPQPETCRRGQLSDNTRTQSGAVAGGTAHARAAAPTRRRRRRRRRAGPRRSGARGRGGRFAAGDQPGRGLPRRLAHGGARPRVRLLRARCRGFGISRLGLSALRPRFAASRRRRGAHDHVGAARAHQRARTAGDPARHRQRHAAAGAAARDPVAAIARGRPRQCHRHGGHHRMVGAQRLQPRLDRARGRRICDPRRHRRSVRARHGRARAPRLFRRHARIDPRLRSGDAAHHRGIARAQPCADGRVSAHYRHYPGVPHRLCGGLRRRFARRHALRSSERRPPSRRRRALAAAIPQADGDAVRLSRPHAGRDRAARRRSCARAHRADRRLLPGAQGRDGPGWRRCAL